MQSIDEVTRACESVTLSDAERHMVGCGGTCGTCASGFSPEHSESLTSGDEAYLREFDELYLLCLADEYAPCVVRKDEFHDECWGSV